MVWIKELLVWQGIALHSTEESQNNVNWKIQHYGMLYILSYTYIYYIYDKIYNIQNMMLFNKCRSRQNKPIRSRECGSFGGRREGALIKRGRGGGFGVGGNVLLLGLAGGYVEMPLMTPHVCWCSHLCTVPSPLSCVMNSFLMNRCDERPCLIWGWKRKTMASLLDAFSVLLPLRSAAMSSLQMRPQSQLTGWLQPEERWARGTQLSDARAPDPQKLGDNTLVLKLLSLRVTW